MHAHDGDALAAAAKVTRRTVERWRREGAPMPRHGEKLKGWLHKLEQWREARTIAKKKPPPPVGEVRKDWDMESKKALALKRMHDLAVAEGDYLPRDQVVGEWTKRVFSVRTRLLSLPRALGSRCANAPPDVVEETADEMVRDMLAEFLAEGPNTPAVEGIA